RPRPPDPVRRHERLGRVVPTRAPRSRRVDRHDRRAVLVGGRAMRPTTSRVDGGSAQYAANRDAYLELVATVRERRQWAIDGGDGRARSIERHLARGKVMVRDRIDMVIDEGTPFL